MKVVATYKNIEIEPGKADDILTYSLGKAEKVCIDMLENGDECVLIKLNRVMARKLAKAIQEVLDE